MDKFVNQLKIAFASQYAFAIKAQNFHWNVEGPDFPQYHEFLGNLYSEVYDNAIDQTAELIRQLDSYTPGSITRFAELSQIPDQTKIPRAELMFAESLQDCEKMIELVVAMFAEAANENQHGIENYMAELQDLYGKKAWFIRSTLKRERE